MSDLLASASQALGVPEPLVKRSAEARAKANGVAPEDVLRAWAGGGAVAAPPREAPPVEEAPAEPTTEVEAPPPEPEPAPAAPAPPLPQVELTAEEEAVPEEVEPAPLGKRIRVAGRAGALAGVAAALVVAVGTAAWTLPRATVVGSEGDWTAAFEAIPGWLVLVHGLIGAALGVVFAGLTRWATGWMAPGMGLVSSRKVTVITGFGVGLVGGALIGGVLAGSGVDNEGVVSVPVLGGLIWSVLGWAALGWAVGAAVQAVGVPEGVEADEEVETVRRRLVTAWSVPVTAIVGILLLVLPLAWVFISYPEWAPAWGSSWPVRSSGSPDWQPPDPGCGFPWPTS
ncbi:MAG: hypothetical protein KatS3mg011_0276 [Acidimicrobiia bacterium]|nr:MAG: hypothetical protein KatS3mg011_0276 [Acidimicrobiia bacterium]